MRPRIHDGAVYASDLRPGDKIEMAWHNYGKCTVHEVENVGVSRVRLDLYVHDTGLVETATVHGMRRVKLWSAK